MQCQGKLKGRLDLALVHVCGGFTTLAFITLQHTYFSLNKYIHIIISLTHQSLEKLRSAFPMRVGSHFIDIQGLS